ncbi:DUF4112 domain-containing protein [Pararhizobium mangrovi]|uniref:DUF4112 domain-containing protein n=1 Tax=Pararhizobium mangrovi TaxID=2590452 RepID=UPI001F43ACD9|nr:DUF4112 domain-containing protein [Pararhizobium mangrovi]
MVDIHSQADEAFRARESEIERLDKLAHFLDTRWGIPGTRFRFGGDAVLGLIPGIGDGASALISAYMIWRAHGHGAPGSLIARMAANVAFDTVVGSVPIAGSVFDVFFRANTRNMALLKEHLEKQQRAARGGTSV